MAKRLFELESRSEMDAPTGRYRHSLPRARVARSRFRADLFYREHTKAAHFDSMALDELRPHMLKEEIDGCVGQRPGATRLRGHLAG